MSTEPLADQGPSVNKSTALTFPFRYVIDSITAQIWARSIINDRLVVGNWCRKAIRRCRSYVGMLCLLGSSDPKRDIQRCYFCVLPEDLLLQVWSLRKHAWSLNIVAIYCALCSASLAVSVLKSQECSQFPGLIEKEFSQQPQPSWHGAIAALWKACCKVVVAPATLAAAWHFSDESSEQTVLPVQHMTGREVDHCLLQHAVLDM